MGACVCVSVSFGCGGALLEKHTHSTVANLDAPGVLLQEGMGSLQNLGTNIASVAVKVSRPTDALVGQGVGKELRARQAQTHPRTDTPTHRHRHRHRPTDTDKDSRAH